MMNSTKNVPVVLPPALDTDETELEARNEFLAENEFSGANHPVEGESSEIIFDESDTAGEEVSEEQEAKHSRRAKRRKSLMFLLIFGAGFGIFVLFISWAFGFGFFAPPNRVAVDRNQKMNAANSTSPNNGDEKLKTALALVANESNSNSPVITDNSTNPNALPEQDLKLNTESVSSPADQPTGNMIVLPDETSRSQVNPTPNRESPSLSPNYVNTKTFADNVSETTTVQPKANPTSARTTSEKSEGAIARSVFFGRVSDGSNNDSRNSSPTNGNISLRNTVSQSNSTNVPVFGSLLPVRLLGAIYTLRESGGLVRMELSRAVKQGSFSYPAGTVIVGRLRGSEYNRAFISIVGAIDPKSGKLVKFEGEVLGIDGASGVKGERKSVKSWGARFLSALRETGGQAVNILSSRSGRGGTIILGGTNGIGGEVSSIVRGNSNTGSFVMVKAGTDAYVLITDLPAEQRSDERLSETNNQIEKLNLSESEMAEFLTTDDPNKLRAFLQKLSPRERDLAIRAMEGK